MVAWVPLDRPAEAAAQLGELRRRPAFAGIRTLIHDQPDPDWLLRPDVGEGLALLESAGIPFDVIAVLPRHLSHVPVLSERYPALRMVLDHLAHPPLDGTGTGKWRALITTAAANPLVYAKVSGLYPPHIWTADDLEEIAGFALGLFGPERLMFGSDWPVAELSGGYAKVRAELSRLLAQLTPATGTRPGRHRRASTRCPPRRTPAGRDDNSRDAQPPAIRGEHATEFLATGTAVRRLADEHRLPEDPRPSPPSPSAWTPDRRAVTPGT